MCPTSSLGFVCLRADFSWTFSWNQMENAGCQLLLYIPPWLVSTWGPGAHLSLSLCSGSCCVKTVSIKTKWIISSDLQYVSVWRTRLSQEENKWLLCPSPSQHVCFYLSSSLCPLFVLPWKLSGLVRITVHLHGYFAMKICPDGIYWLWAGDLLEISLHWWDVFKFLFGLFDFRLKFSLKLSKIILIKSN